MAATRPVSISVIVPFRNAERHFASLLESLSCQTIAEPWEVILVDNASTDRSRGIAERFASRIPSTIVDACDIANPSYARNVGVKSSSGPKLLFIDADDEVHPVYVSAMARALDRHGLVTSRVDSVSLNPEWVRGAHGPPWQQETIAVPFDFLPAAGPNIGIHRQLFESVGGFAEHFAPSEDIAFSWMARLRANMEVQFVREAVYRYRYRDTLSGLFFQNIRWGESGARLYTYFRDAGMERRSLRSAAAEWRQMITALPRIVRPTARARFVVQLGFCAGRIIGSVRQRVMFF
jgi:glycosyltransferase involved in cell wall biosynthesis